MYDLKTKATVKLADEEIDEAWEVQPRQTLPTLSVKERKANFAEIELNFSEYKAKQEAKRCLRCDLET
jgi:hypothetical protein